MINSHPDNLEDDFLKVVAKATTKNNYPLTILSATLDASKELSKSRDFPQNRKRSLIESLVFFYFPVKEETSNHEIDNSSDVDVDHFDEHENNTVIDLSSSGCCSWCHKQGPCTLVDLESTSASGRKIRKRFCSERCFGLHRRAMFKKSKRCEWCHAGLSDSDASFGASGLHFCR